MLKNVIAHQLRKPDGWLGKVVTRSMERRNSHMYVQAIPAMKIQSRDHLMEIGFGPGTMIHLILLEYPDVRITGVDFSELMVEKCRRRNDAFIRAGRLKLFHGNVLDPDLSFTGMDIVYACNVIYFWDDLQGIFQKVHAALRAGGKFFLYMSDDHALRKMGLDRTTAFHLYTSSDVTYGLEQAGFCSIALTPLRNSSHQFFITGMKAE